MLLDIPAQIAMRGKDYERQLDPSLLAVIGKFRQVRFMPSRTDMVFDHPLGLNRPSYELGIIHHVKSVRLKVEQNQLIAVFE